MLTPALCLIIFLLGVCAYLVAKGLFLARYLTADEVFRNRPTPIPPEEDAEHWPELHMTFQGSA